MPGALGCGGIGGEHGICSEVDSERSGSRVATTGRAGSMCLSFVGGSRFIMEKRARLDSTPRTAAGIGLAKNKKVFRGLVYDPPPSNFSGMPKLKLASDVGPRMSRHRDGHLPFATKRAANELLARCRRRALLDHALRAGSERVPSTGMDSCVVSIRSRCVLVGGCMVEQLPWCCS